MTTEHPVPPPPARPDTPGGAPTTPPDTPGGGSSTPPDTWDGGAPPPPDSLVAPEPQPGPEQGPDAQPEPEEEPEPFLDGPPPLPRPMLVLDGELPEEPGPAEEEEADHGTCRCGGAFDADGWCTECGERRPDPRHHFTSRPSELVAAVCDRGIRHQDNEDAMAVWAGEEGRAALVVCDGVTTASRSAEASLAAAEAALQVLSAGEGAAADRVVRATDAAAQAVDQVGRDYPDSAPSCTYVAVVVEDGLATVGSVGDSRAYWLPDAGGPRRLTTDDSMAEEQVRGGLDRASAEAGPLAHTITRWLGPDSPDHRPVLTTQEVAEPGWLLACTDGLWNYASEPADLLAVLREQERAVGRDPLDLAQALVAWANSRGGADNITAALARTGSGPRPPVVSSEPTVETPHPAAEADATVPVPHPGRGGVGAEGQDGTHG